MSKEQKLVTIKAKEWTELPGKLQLEYRSHYDYYIKYIAGKTFYACRYSPSMQAYEIKPYDNLEVFFLVREAAEEFPLNQDVQRNGPNVQKKRERLDVMLDIESLSTAHNGATIQIAAIPFKIEGSDDEVVMTQFNRLISPKSCIEAGLDVNADTMKWWFSQDAEIQNRVLVKAIQIGGDLEYILNDLTEYFKGLEEQAEKVFIWGYPATSDMTWLQQAYLAAKLPYPVAYNRTRCLGSIADLYWEATGKKLSEQATTKINHDALVDCQSQIEMVCLAYKELGYLNQKEVTK